jgi:hypothetical protein
VPSAVDVCAESAIGEDSKQQRTKLNPKVFNSNLGVVDRQNFDRAKLRSAKLFDAHTCCEGALPPRTSCRPRPRILLMAARHPIQEGILVTLATSPATCRIPSTSRPSRPSKTFKILQKFTNKSESGRAFPLSKFKTIQNDAHC